MPLREETPAARQRVVEKIFHKLAKIFNGLHWGIGITTLPATAASREERSFSLMWLGIIVFMIVFFVVFIYLLGRF
jgi:hypothetical protein